MYSIVTFNAPLLSFTKIDLRQGDKTRAKVIANGSSESRKKKRGQENKGEKKEVTPKGKDADMI